MSKKKEPSLRDAFELIPDAVVIYASTGRVIDCNQAAVRQFGLSSKWNLLGTTIFEWIVERDKKRAIKNEAIVIEEGSKRNVEYQFLKEDGSEFPAEVSVVLVDSGPDKPSVKVGIIRDISLRKKMEEELAEGKETIRALLNAPQDTAYLIDRFGIVYASNETGARVLGKRSNEIVGLNLFRLLPADLARSRREKVEEVVQKGIPVRFEDQLGRRFYENIVYPVYGQGRTVTRLALFARDITERMQMEEELKHYSEHLKELVDEQTKQLRDAERLAAIGETATMVGHDLRNPLQVIINTVFLARTEAEEAQLNMRKKIEELGFIKTFDIIDRQVDYMNKIVSDLQDFARDVKPRIEKSSLNDLIRDSIPTTVPASINITMNLNVDTAFFDPHMMKRVMVNLITNAIQAMPNGGELDLKTFLEGDSIIIKVTDTGVGIPDDFKPKLFKPLYTTKSIGTGMGLSVVKRFIVAHNGSIDVESTVGKGTTFTIKIPTKPLKG